MVTARVILPVVLFMMYFASPAASAAVALGSDGLSADQLQTLYDVAYHNKLSYYTKTKEQIAELEAMTCDVCNGPAETYQNVTVFEKNTDVVIVGYNKRLDAIIAAWRGSSTIVNWLQDFDFVQVTWADDKNVKVHRGFKNSMYNVQDTLKARIVELKNMFETAKVYITGHSLGAAQAELCAVDMMQTMDNWSDGSSVVTNVFPVAAPLVGNSDFAQLSEKLLPNAIRLLNKHDPVGMVPPTYFGYTRYGREIFMFQDDASVRAIDNYEKPTTEEAVKQQIQEFLDYERSPEGSASTLKATDYCINLASEFCKNFSYGQCDDTYNLFSSRAAFHDLGVYLCRYQEIFHL